MQGLDPSVSNTVSQRAATGNLYSKKVSSASRDNQDTDIAFSQAFNCLNQAIRIIDTQYRVRFINQAFAKLCGIDQEKALGKKCWEVFNTPFCHQADCSLEKIINRSKEFHLEYSEVCKNCLTAPFIFSVFPLFSQNGALIGIMQSFRDTSKRKKLQERVVDNKKRLQTLFEHLPIAAWEIDLSRAKQRMNQLCAQGIRDLKTYLAQNPEDPLITRFPEYARYIHVNKAAFDLYGLDITLTSITRFQETLSQRINSSEAEMEIHIDILDVLYNANTPYEREYELAGPNGDTRKTILKISVPSGHKKDLSRVFFTMYEITRLRRAENELKKHQHNLERLVEERTIKLNSEIEKSKIAETKLKIMIKKERTLYRKLKNQMDEKARFTAMLAHELKTPITPVISASDYLVNNLKEEPFGSFARQINRGILRLSARIDELLDINRGELGMLRLKRKSLNIEGLLRECHSVFLPLAAEHSLSLNLNVPKDMMHVRADGDRIRQVIFNLLDNAIRYTPKGGAVIINARDEAGKTLVEICNTDFSLRDKKDRELFLPYWKRSDGNELKEGSHGLGLSICKMLIGLHGENLWVEMRPEIGTVFGFALPHLSVGKTTGGKVENFDYR
ncbi:MAG: PAS domain-containing sensor histidine kinase [Dehalococcoidaceae bacterium]|nr:PAS domain-containing sensor histidine kinase [Dehalococcoidaceae bacterium]